MLTQFPSLQVNSLWLHPVKVIITVLGSLIEFLAHLIESLWIVHKWVPRSNDCKGALDVAKKSLLSNTVAIHKRALSSYLFRNIIQFCNWTWLFTLFQRILIQQKLSHHSYVQLEKIDCPAMSTYKLPTKTNSNVLLWSKKHMLCCGLEDQNMIIISC